MNNIKQLHVFDTVSTPNGKGILIAQDGCGNFFVAILRENLVNKTCTGPCLHLWFKLEELGDAEEQKYDQKKSRSGYVTKKKFVENVKEIFDANNS